MPPADPENRKSTIGMMTFLSNCLKAVGAATWMHFLGARGKMRQLQSQTLQVFPGHLAPEVCSELIERIEDAISQGPHPRLWQDAAGSDTRILGFDQDIPDILAEFDIDNLVSAIDAYTGRRTKSWFLMANRVVPRYQNLGSGGGWHRDSPFSHQVKCIWYLSDVGLDNGAFQYIPGTNVNLISTCRVYPLGQTRFDSIHTGEESVVANAGTLLVCDTKCIHRGRPIKSGARYAITLYTSPKAGAIAKTFEKSGIDPRLATKDSQMQ